MSRHSYNAQRGGAPAPGYQGASSAQRDWGRQQSPRGSTSRRTGYPGPQPGYSSCRQPGQQPAYGNSYQQQTPPWGQQQRSPCGSRGVGNSPRGQQYRSPPRQHPFGGGHRSPRAQRPQRCVPTPPQGEDLYAVLELPRSCSAEDIRRQYKRLAVKWHPDKNPQNRGYAEARFKQVSEAYEVLSDPTRRRLYDQHGMAGIRDGGPGGSGGGGGGYARPGHFYFHDPFDVFREFFGGQDPFASFFGGGMMGGGMGMPSLFSMMQPMSLGQGGAMMSFSSGGPGMVQMQSSMSSFGGGGGGRSVSQQTVIRDGRQVTRKVTRTQQADGTVHEDVEEFVDNVPQGSQGGTHLITNFGW